MENQQDVVAPSAAGQKEEGQHKSEQDEIANFKKTSMIGLSIIVLGNLAQLLGSLEKVNEQVQKMQEQLKLGTTPYLLFIVVGMIFLGYLLTFTSLYKRLKKSIGQKKLLRTLVVGGIVFGSMGTLFAFNIMLFPPINPKILAARKAIWVDKLRGTQQPEGGFKTYFWDGVGNPVQVFTTAQGLTGIISATNWDDKRQQGYQDRIDAIRSAFNYIDGQRNPDGGWGYYPGTQSITEIGAWVTVARVKALEHADDIWRSESERAQQLNAVVKDLERMTASYVSSQQAWSPLALSPAAAPNCVSPIGPLQSLETQPPARTYSTAMVLWSLLEAHRVSTVKSKIGHKYDDKIKNGIGWLLSGYNVNIGTWLPNPYRPNQKEDYLGLTGQILYVLYHAKLQPEFKDSVNQPNWTAARKAFLNKQIKKQLLGDNAHLSDMDSYIFPNPQPLEPTTFLWSPWSMVAYSYLAQDSDLSASDRKLASANMEMIIGIYQGQLFEKIESGGTYELAENLICVADAFPHATIAGTMVTQ